MIMAKLKESTRGQHEALESVVDVMNRTLSIDEYKDLLIKFYRFYQAVEPRLPADELLKSGFDIRPRLKSSMLERDLVHLGVKPGSVPPWTGVPQTQNAAQAFGAVYVMEGATLGGQVITRHLHQHLGLTPEQGGAFFNSYGREVGPMWKAFGASVTAYSEVHPENDEAIVTAAGETFDSFRKCFEETLVAEATGS